MTLLSKTFRSKDLDLNVCSGILQTASTHLGCCGDDSLQRSGGAWGVPGVTAGVLGAVVMVVVAVGCRAFQQLLPASRRLALGVEGGAGGSERS